MMDTFNIDLEIVNSLEDISDEDLLSFAEMHDEPGDDMHIELSIYAFFVAFQRLGSPELLTRALVRAEGWVAITSDDHPERHRRVKILDAMAARQEGEAMADLEESIRVAREAVNATPEDHPHRPALLHNLGIGLGDRYSRTRAMADLEESIRVAKEALSATPEGHPGRGQYLSNLGIHLGHRYSRTGAMADLEESIRVAREAVNTTPEDHPDRAGQHGRGLTLRGPSELHAKLSMRHQKTIQTGQTV
ncbi:hypothetical protein CNMCM6106_008548 [Aspergillus hiratsukae]|uniref:Anaphase-promoting complex subunit 5 domain-containing protein n=1 Tax=Aspergillus hiratsukae TaxID=1194566 RepID=A0A8H6QK85_9EURO|nr:hypothetical protein CNMCM6106_008548 [Aspergillus hiratsukae]